MQTFFYAKKILQLTKARLTTSVVFSSVMGYLLSTPVVDYITMLVLFIGGYCTVSAANIFNQVYEKDIDAQMKRTQNRPLPKEVFSLKQGRIIAIIFLIIGAGFLFTINLKVLFFGLLSTALYVLAYTPLKSETPWAVFVGAFPGAIPFMLGWVAGTNHFGIEAGILFLIQFTWQFPHFWSIGWLGYEDYAKVGYYLLPSKKKDFNSAFQTVVYTITLIPITLLPTLGFTGDFKLSIEAGIIVAALGLVFSGFSLQLLKKMDKVSARNLLIASVLYLPIIQIIYVVDRFIRL